jgi:hypothetical protein
MFPARKACRPRHLFHYKFLNILLKLNCQAIFSNSIISDNQNIHPILKAS